MTANQHCKNGHDMRLVDVHLKSVCATTVHSPLHGGPNLQLIKEYECAVCDDRQALREEIE